MTAELKACPIPWCASRNVKVERFVCIRKPGDHSDRAVVCQDCQCGTRVMCTEAEAITAWNTRTDPDHIAAIRLARDWLQQASDWLLSTDLDMTCPMETDPLDIVAHLDTLLQTKGDDRGEG